MPAKHMLFWGQIQQPACGGWDWAEGSKGLLFTPASFIPELHQALKNKGLRMKHGNRPPDVFFFFLLWLILYLFSVFYCTLPSGWQSSFQDNSVAGYFFTGCFWMSVTEMPNKSVWCFLQIGMPWWDEAVWGRMGHFHLCCSCPFSHFPKHHIFFTLCPFLHMHIHPKYPSCIIFEFL